ncbi:mitochondrial assembly of ribosomal large subunit protein 1 [Stegastes partitus]|uniref:Mitochondrial assembly of ribosomal large subunit protein 1 n=1 Tax=Stegastes partitus TaxID=144197 RepID=A0A3B5AA62_9TELE|nr:PREDICTED: mitochondrial assembly of ribosomal large subunit protein 1 [Stegastes partitus]
MQLKIMNVLCRSRKLVSSLFRNNVLVEKAQVLGSSLPNARCYSLYQSQHLTANVASCQHWHHAASFSCHVHTKRCYSDSSEWRNSTSTGLSEEESHEMGDSSSNNSVLRQSSSQTFDLDVVVSLLRQENAVDICVIKIPEHIKYAEYLIVVSGMSPRHIRAMALYAVKVYKFLKKKGDPHVKTEGKDAEDWMCVDFGKVVVHFMLPETREVYELEKLWTLRGYDEQLKNMPDETLPEDFMLGVKATK